ncbi:hypothetical protein SELMODRAFT_86191 [Selaginella moellendorffii]|uniref:Succinate dehydrogenase [ubiquinone] iron-sulfur subunit, mitochondrial n=2 Tax=Selaginella moellendorffii TaxID=88036 RepID=D8R556_SELML|nr:hypothetical protein SELMODRAFT_86191 [Selaginella moellendorffii]
MLSRVLGSKRLTSNGLRSFQVYRYNPQDGKSPHLQEYKVDISNCVMMLDVLFEIKNKHDSSITFRRSCREGVCGSCAMNINGKNCLACLTKVDRDEDGIASTVVLPLPHMFVIKDLVVDMTYFYQQYKSIEPWLKTKTQKEDGQKEFLQTKEERAKLDGMWECILCACCNTSCPSYWWNTPTFPGPAILLQAYKMIADSRDDFTKERVEALRGEMKIGRCHTIRNCSNACPKGLNPAEKILQIKGMLG